MSVGRLSKVIVKTIKGTQFVYDWDKVELVVQEENLVIADYETEQTLLIVPLKNLEYVKNE
ncbi:hypothetical protein [Sellimonas catena]|uniref:Uncharacterized protein n=1 Tax=Sellimonas catena TaxID=2994035 RepID=A0A9W6CFP5_9FIRM|nr:hypothetical protein [Sellimonas catena]GLG90417.1 hypothetical protein Selli2_18440 [Sellimonas catena]